MKLEEIGFYSLHDERAKNTSSSSPMQRCEVLITEDCNFSCPYCKMKKNSSYLSFEDAKTLIDYWADDGLVNIRFSGGEPTMNPYLYQMVEYAKSREIKRIAISTNGSMVTEVYHDLVQAGVNDFSISLDACCASDGDIMAGGVEGSFYRGIENIKYLSARTYVTVGVVITHENVSNVANIVRFAHELGVADIRLISAAQYNVLLKGVEDIDPQILEAHPILKYRVNNILAGHNVRGMKDCDSHTCYLIQDDSVVVNGKHYPCVIHMRESGKPIGKIGPNMRQERIAWMKNHDPHDDPICRSNCLDICILYSNKVRSFHKDI